MVGYTAAKRPYSPPLGPISMESSPPEDPRALSQRPVVVIPGILGSKLVDGRGEVVWGERTSLGRFGRLDLGSAGSDITPNGLIDRIRVLGPFWTIHAYEDLLSHLRDLGFQIGESLFLFAYDWRRSNFDTAHDFGAWVRSHPRLQDGRFDIVAHSMGGMIARLWMLEHGGAGHVRKALYLGTPFLGSMNALATLTDGWGVFANYIAGGIDVIRRTMLSFPALYELFPRYGKACRFGDRRSYTAFNVYDPAHWNAYDWLPEEYRDGGQRAAAFRENLARADRLASIVSRSVPGVEELRIAGDHQDTRLYLYVDRDRPGWRNWTFSSSRGDGTVPLWSAANAASGDLAGALPSFVEHATIFRDEWVKTVLLRELVVTAPPLVNARTSDIMTSGGSAERLEVLDAQLDPPIAAPGTVVRLVVTLRFPADAGIVRGDVSCPTARIAGTSALVEALVDVTEDAGLAEKKLTFVANLTAPANEEVYRVDVDLPPLGQRAVYLTVEQPR